MSSLMQARPEMISYNLIYLSRYEIDDSAIFSDAEKALKAGNGIIAVKSKKSKRKAGETAAEIYEAEMGEKAGKKMKKSGAKKSRT